MARTVAVCEGSIGRLEVCRFPGRPLSPSPCPGSPSPPPRSDASSSGGTGSPSPDPPPAPAPQGPGPGGRAVQVRLPLALHSGPSSFDGPSEMEIWTEDLAARQLLWLGASRPALYAAYATRWSPRWTLEVRGLSGPVDRGGVILQEASGFRIDPRALFRAIYRGSDLDQDGPCTAGSAKGRSPMGSQSRSVQIWRPSSHATSTTIVDILDVFKGRTFDRVALTTRAPASAQESVSDVHGPSARLGLPSRSPSPPATPSAGANHLSEDNVEGASVAYELDFDDFESESGPEELSGWPFGASISGRSISSEAESGGENDVDPELHLEFESPLSGRAIANGTEESESDKSGPSGQLALEPSGPYYDGPRSSARASSSSDDRNRSQLQQLQSQAVPRAVPAPRPVVGPLSTEFLLTSDRALLQLQGPPDLIEVRRDLELHLREPPLLATAVQRVAALRSINELYLVDDSSHSVHHSSLTISSESMTPAAHDQWQASNRYPSGPWIEPLSSLQSLTRLALVEFGLLAAPPPPPPPQGPPGAGPEGSTHLEDRTIDLAGLEKLRFLRRLEILDCASSRVQYYAGHESNPRASGPDSDREPAARAETRTYDPITMLQQGLSSLESFAFIGSVWRGERLLTFATAIQALTELHFCSAFQPTHGDAVQEALRGVVASLPSLTNLKRLGLLALPAPLYGPLEASLRQMRTLERLQVGLVGLCGATWTGYDAPPWALAGVGTSLTTLVLACVHPRGSPLANTVQLASLRELDLRWIGSDEDALPVHLNLTRLTALTRLSIAQAIPLIVEFKPPRGLRALHLRLYDRSFCTRGVLGPFLTPTPNEAGPGTSLGLISLDEFSLSFHCHGTGSSARFPLYAIKCLPVSLKSLTIQLYGQVFVPTAYKLLLRGTSLQLAEI